MKKVVRFIILADIHIGNTRIVPYELLQRLKRYLYSNLQQCDVLVIAGDMFDTLVTLDNEHANMAIHFMSELFILSKEYGFKIRVIRGTYTHDRDQNHVFSSINARKTTDADYRYIDKITFETLKLGDRTFKVCYLPDNLPYRKPKDVIKVIDENLDGDPLDIIFGHGQFKHVLPPGIKLPAFTYEVEMFEDVVTGPIVFGHVHATSSYKNMHYSGSFDRFRFGEEEPKGYLSLVYTEEGYHLEFNKNQEATRFDTINVSKYDTDKGIELVDRKIKSILKQQAGIVSDEEEKIPYSVYLKFTHNDKTVRSAIYAYIKELYKDSKIPIRLFESDTRSKKVDIKTLETMTRVTKIEPPTKDNIYEHISQFIEENDKVVISTSEVTSLIRQI